VLLCGEYLHKMKTQAETIAIEDLHMPPFAKKMPIAIERGEGVYVWDQTGKQYLDFTAGWGVTCIGHANPVITEALLQQSQKIIQNPNSGATYSPARARLLELLTTQILPANLTRVFFSNSGAEANDAAIKLARKVSGRQDVISTERSFHGRTISTASATGQAAHRDKFRPLMPNYKFVPYNNLEAMEKAIDAQVAAVILEPIQGEGGVIVPSDGYLEGVSALCCQHGVLLIVDEIQTGFYRTGPAFAITPLKLKADFLTMAKGLAGGFPFGAFAMSEEVAQKIEEGDHGGTYCGNPLGCAVSYSVVNYLLEHDIESHVQTVGASILTKLQQWQRQYPPLIVDVRGRGLLLALEFHDKKIAAQVYDQSLNAGLLLNLKHGTILRLFPALTITREEAEEGLRILHKAIESVI
jgi:acetylornithine/N-succinyldiaminopimelate aminotransferase